MVRYCIVSGCNSHSLEKKLSFHKIPSVIKDTNKTYRGNERNLERIKDLTSRRQDAWIRILKLGKISESRIRNGFVCQKHFLNGICSKI